jgi:hypothetical protein
MRPIMYVRFDKTHDTKKVHAFDVDHSVAPTGFEPALPP